MADKNIDKDTLKAKKEAEKAAEKAKKERIKQSKPKKEGNAFSRGGAAVKKFCKDFAGTCKKVSWPTAKQVLKNSGVVLATIIVIGIAVALVDLALTELFDLGNKAVVELAENMGGETTEAASANTNTNTNTNTGTGTSEQATEHDHDHDHETESESASGEDVTGEDVTDESGTDETVTGENEDTESTTAE